VYGFHFTKEDHIKLVKLLFELVTIPNLESPLLNSWSSLLIDLLRDKKLLSPEDIQFPWRSLYELLLRISNSKMKKLGAKTYGDNTIATVKKLISSVRCYYTTETTGEMLKEWRPLLCPFDTAMFDAMEYFSDFLPTLTYPEYYHLTHELWFNELINLWLESRNNNQIDEFCVKLFSQLSQDTLGHIDWSPYYSQIFTRILNSFELPMGSKEFQLPQTKKISDLTNGSKFATLIVYLLGGPNSCQSYLTKLMTSLESYYHPSNIGFHTKKLLKFLEQLTTSFILRLKKERYTKPSWIPVPPKEYHLTEDDIDSFVQPLLPILWLSIFNKLSAVEASISVQNLALLRPALIFPPLMEKYIKLFKIYT
jgi:proteasome activator subunit 4